MSNENLEFSTVYNTIPVTIDGRQYELREATGKQTTKYINAKMAAMRFDSKGQFIGVGNVANLVPMLVSMTLYDLDTGKNVPESVVCSWPSRIQEAIADKSLDLSDLREVDASPISSMERALSRPESPVSMMELMSYLETHLHPKDDKPLLHMIRRWQQENDSEGESDAS